jgi:plasmid replication initiation protein
VWSSLRHISSGGGVAYLAKAIGNTLHTVGPMSHSFFPWFHRIDYKWGEGVIEAILHPELKPYLLQLKEQYTAITLEYALLLRSSYAHRIYDILKQYQHVGTRTIMVTDLREMLEIRSREYPKYADFRRRVLETA